MLSINMARKPGLPSFSGWGLLTLLFPMNPQIRKLPLGNSTGNKQCPVSQKILEANGNALSLGQILLYYFPLTLDKLLAYKT